MLKRTAITPHFPLTAPRLSELVCDCALRTEHQCCFRETFHVNAVVSVSEARFGKLDELCPFLVWNTNLRDEISV
jgi:hypothetical protein